MSEKPSFVGLTLGSCATRLWGISGDERARRTVLKAGATALAADLDAAAAAPACLMIRADWVVDPALVSVLAKQVGSLLVTRGEGGRLIPLAAHVSGADVAATAAALGGDAPWPATLTVIEHDPAQPSIYLQILRKRLTPAVLPLTEDTIDAAERATFSGAYKGVTDLVTKYAWPAPARHVTRWCAEAGISPNQVTLASLVLVFVAMALFAQGYFALGLVAAWVMTFLDTVDGKLARVTLTSTRFGNVFDHGIDMIHPPFWWLAWHWGCQKAGVAYPMADLALALAFGGYVVLRLQEGAFILLYGIQIHIWRRVDSLFRLIVSRRNPNLILLTLFVAAGQPGWGMVAVAAWTALSILVHAVQFAQALIQGRRPLDSWMAA